MIPSTFKDKAQCRHLASQLKHAQVANEDALLDQHISWAEDEHTAAAKADINFAQCKAIDLAHSKPTKIAPSFLQSAKNTGLALVASLK